MSKPIHRIGLSRSLLRISSPMTATMIGTEAMSSPVSELEIERSASDKTSHGTMTSTNANSTTQRHTGLIAAS